MPVTKRLNPTERKKLILAAAVEVAQKPGAWAKLTRADVAKGAKCSEALVSFYLGSMKSLRRSILKEAIRLESLDIITQEICAKTSSVTIPDALRKKAAKKLLET